MTTCVIPAAGYGTRLLPVTRFLPKAVLPLGTMPIIVDILWEAYRAGIQDVILITHWREKIVEEIFQDDSGELIQWLKQRGRNDLVEKLVNCLPKLNLIFLHQPKLNGLGGAILLAERYIEDIFVVMLADNVIIEVEKGSLIEEMLKVQKSTKASTVLSTAKIDWKDVSRFGVIKFSKIETIDNVRVYCIEDLIEKPPPESAPSNFAIVGRYVLTPEIFDYLRQVPEEKGEIDETKAFKMQLVDGKKIIAIDLDYRKWFDVGNIEGYFKAFLAFILQKEGEDKVEQWIQEVCEPAH
ncbi:MAG: sugar phosphate nucleotidyltransferase [Crenarchaeota archaeon]|nr:sugar phosphate nucleotidyltransferase [Thermoproteota archaeon]